MLEIGVNKRTLYINGEKIEISIDLANWIATNTQIAVTFKVN